MTLPTGTGDPTDRPTDRAWSGLTSRLNTWGDQVTSRTLRAVADYRPTPTTEPTDRRRPDRSGGPSDRLRYVPPVAALGTAFVMQVIAVTDLVGEATTRTARDSGMPWLADHPTTGYLAGFLLGLAVASAAEGGAAYLMDLYDRHLLARDSVWMLRLAMAAYVAGSAAAIHWWADHRGLPDILSWLLAGMSASALFLWSRGSRWRNRVAMVAAGQLDPAMPRLPMAAKVLHPWRWLVTLYLISWEPASTTDEARARYAAWATARADRRGKQHAARESHAATDRATADRITAVVEQPAETPTDHATPPAVDRPTTRALPAAPRRPRPTTTPTGATNRAHSPAAVANAAVLRARYGDHLPTVARTIRTDTKWSPDRVNAAVAAYHDGADQQPPTDAHPA